jgi:hypothetical protein
MTEIHGIAGAPYQTPGVRKKLPAPFERSRVDLDGGRRVKRSWKDISVLEVKRGDTVSGFGVVSETVEFVNIPTVAADSEEVPGRPYWRFRLHNVLGDYQDYPGEQRVYAFTPDE